ncbi:unnamed protein product [Moneuplotes crassus]|uniref:Palmitoyltransferase n=1 Tax=Euplotes crassus TaxID=5936 RepID=A0AAD1XLR9_EUPCR|nr:unnamed protein product [Moneuplotes crassus]
MDKTQNRVPFTRQIWKRYDRGGSFFAMTGFYLYLVIILTFVYIPEFRKVHGEILAALVHFISLFLGFMSYWCFFKTAMANPGDVDPNYIHPMPDPLDLDSGITNPSSEQRFEYLTEAIYSRILTNFDKFAIQERKKFELIQNTQEDKEVSECSSLTRQQQTKTLIINNFCYKHCVACRMDQPPRAKHCDFCKRCVLRYDHHCFILGNCIGLHNFKPFLLLQYYTCLGGANLLGWFIYGLTVQKFGSEEFLLFFAEYIFPIFLLCFMTFGTFCQAIVNTYYLLKNRTQQDIIQNFRVNIFDTGSWSSNAKEVFGTRGGLLWFLPVDTGEKPTDGHNFNFYYL